MTVKCASMLLAALRVAANAVPRLSVGELPVPRSSTVKPPLVCATPRRTSEPAVIRANSLRQRRWSSKRRKTSKHHVKWPQLSDINAAKLNADDGWADVEWAHAELMLKLAEFSDACVAMSNAELKVDSYGPENLVSWWQRAHGPFREAKERVADAAAAVDKIRLRMRELESDMALARKYALRKHNEWLLLITPMRVSDEEVLGGHGTCRKARQDNHLTFAAGVRKNAKRLAAKRDRANGKAAIAEADRLAAECSFYGLDDWYDDEPYEVFEPRQAGAFPAPAWQSYKPTAKQYHYGELTDFGRQLINGFGIITRRAHHERTQCAPSLS